MCLCKDVLISHKVFLKLFCRSQLLHKSVNLSFAFTNMKNKLTDFSGNWLLQTDSENTLCEMNPGHNDRQKPGCTRRRVRLITKEAIRLITKEEVRLITKEATRPIRLIKKEETGPIMLSTKEEMGSMRLMTKERTGPITCRMGSIIYRMEPISWQAAVRNCSCKLCRKTTRILSRKTTWGLTRGRAREMGREGTLPRLRGFQRI